MGKFDALLIQIEGFIKKYYKNEMIKGLILFVSLLSLSYAAVSYLEYVGRFSGGVRKFMLLSFIGLNVVLLSKFLVIPLLRLNKVARRISLNEASVMIGRIFPEVGDKLRNTLEFGEKAGAEGSLSLLSASLDQRSEQLSAVPFTKGIDFRENKKYLKVLVPIFLGIGLVAVINPNIFKEGSERIVNFDQDYIEEAPFNFEFLSDATIQEGQDYTLSLKLTGDEIPTDVMIITNQGNFNLKKNSAVEFEYTFQNVRDDLSVVAEANGFKSKVFEVKVLAKPIIEDLVIDAVFPKHTGMSPKTFAGTGDVVVPEGTILKWKMNARNLSQLEVAFSDTLLQIDPGVSTSFNWTKRFLSSDNYQLFLSSPEVIRADSFAYQVGVVKDEYPKISIREYEDSTNQLLRFIEGSISDDYGFRSLQAKFKVFYKDSSSVISKSIKLSGNSNEQIFSQTIDIQKFNLKPGDKLEYTFYVTDNDEVNGFKTSSSQRNVFVVPDLNELDDLLSSQSDKLKEDMKEVLKDSDELKKKIKDVKSNLMNKSNPDWKDKQQMQNMMDLKKQLDMNVQKLQKSYEKQKNDQQNFLEQDEEFLEKQEKLQELLDALMDEELMELFEELQELMEEMNKDKLLENLEEMEKESESMEEKMDRTLELFKNMELDQKLKSVEDQLRELKEQQEELTEMMEDKKLSKEELAKKQKELNEKFDDVKEDIKEAQEKNEDLENPRDLDFDQELQDQIDQEMDDSKESLEKGQKGKSQKSQQNASQKMGELADSIAQMQSQSQQQQQQEDMEALRYLLENLVGLSQDEEELMNLYQQTQSSDPYYLELNRQQLRIDNSTNIVRDSLLALSKRVHQLSTFINDELGELNYNLDKSLVLSEERNTRGLLQYQQYAMTDYNDLALMLSEVLDQMQQSAQSSMPGSGQCNKPGGTGKGQSSGSMSMEQMKQAMKDQIGKMKGGNKPGGEDGKGKDGMNGQPGGNADGKIPGLSTKEQVKMAAEQARIRESLKQLKEELNKDGSGAGNGLEDLIKDMDKLEEDLLNGNVGTDFVKRQEDILSRLLESDKALRERGFSEEREANEGKNVEEGNLIEFTEYNRKKDAEVEFMRSLPLGLQVYYKTLVNSYFNSVNN